MSNVEKIHHLKYLLDIFFEPNDVIDKIPGTGLFTNASEQISRITGSSQGEREQRIIIFLTWLQQEDDGNKYKEFVDVLRRDKNYEWLTPLLEDCENDPSDFLTCFKHLSKPKKVSLIFNRIFPSLANINVVDIIGRLTDSLTESDREEIRKTVTNKSNRYGLISLLNKLIYKRPVWIEEFVKAVESLGYAPANSMFDETKYLNLSEPLKEYLGLFNLPEDDNGQEYMEITEEQELSNYATARFQPFVPVHDRQVETDYRADKVVDQCKVFDQSVDMKPSSPPITEGFTLREYQKELCKSAVLGENIVICAQTGSGKTVVAAHILHEHLYRGQSSNPKVAFFTPTGGLAEQQFDKMKKHLPNAKIEVLRGNFGTEHVEKNFKKKIYSSDLIVMTPQILLNCLQDKSVGSVFDFSLMIFDECHHVNGCEPYSEILKLYLDEKLGVNSRNSSAKKTLQIIGLTATLGIGSAETDTDALKHIFKILGIMDAVDGIAIVKKNIPELHQYCHTPKEDNKIIDIGKDDDFKKMISKTTKALASVLEKTGVFNKFGKIQHPNGKMDELGKDFETWCCRLRHASGDLHDDDSTTMGRDAGSGASAMQCMKKGYDLCLNCQPTDAIGLIEEFVTSYFKEQQEKNTDYEKIFHQLMDEALSEFKKYVGYTKNEVLKIIEEKIVEKYQANRNSRCMVMVSRRHFAKCLQRWMEDLTTLQQFHPRIYIGVGNKSSSCSGMSHQKQKQAIESFKSGHCRILICTPDAAGEGTDNPDCNLVVTVDCIKNEIAKAQLSGRVRAEGGEVLHIHFANGRRKDELTNTKLLLMKKTTREVDKIFCRERDRYKKLLQDGQRQVIYDLEQTKIRNISKTSPRMVGNDKMLCRKCSRFICNTHNLIRINGTHHTVAISKFRDQYFKSDHPTKGSACGNMTHLYRIRCNKCKQEWGNEVRWNDRLVPVLTIKGFKIKDSRGKIFQPSTWKKTGLNIHEMSVDNAQYKTLFLKYVAED